MMRHSRTVAAAALAFVAALPAARAETVQFTAVLAGDNASPTSPGGGQGTAKLTLDRTSKTVTWTIQYSGLPAAVQSVGCGAMQPQTAPSIMLTGNLPSPINGSKVLSDAESNTLMAGNWVCVIGGEGIDSDLGGVVQRAP